MWSNVGPMWPLPRHPKWSNVPQNMKSQHWSRCVLSQERAREMDRFIADIKEQEQTDFEGAEVEHDGGRHERDEAPVVAGSAT